MSDTHFNQPQRRAAKFYSAPNHLKKKVGHGGISEDILKRAEELIENNSEKFDPIAEIQLSRLNQALTEFRIMADNADGQSSENIEDVIFSVIYPAVQIKGTGGMFKYPLVTDVADKMVQFLEVIEKPDAESLEILEGFETALRAIVRGHIKDDGGPYGQELLIALNQACLRYFDKNPENINNKAPS